jgi:hypothetical protein
MPDNPQPGTQSVSDVRTRLHDAATMLRESASLDAEARRTLAELLDELGRALESTAAPPSEMTRLAEGAAHLAESLHQGHDEGLLQKTRDRLEGLMLQAEARAPTAVGLTRRLIDALANLGI